MEAKIPTIRKIEIIQTDHDGPYIVVVTTPTTEHPDGTVTRLDAAYGSTDLLGMVRQIVEA